MPDSNSWRYEVEILELRPTQLALGMKEVHARAEKLKEMNAADRKKHLEKHLVPVVLAPRNIVYCIDRHHLVRSCWEIGIDKVHTVLKADFSNLPEESVWKMMTEAKWLYLYDQFGNGPHGPLDMPMDIRGMADDPFRSLAWLVREAGGYNKTETPFAEFGWANFFRGKKDELHPVKIGFEAAQKIAMKMAKTPEAKNLPGFKG